MKTKIPKPDKQFLETAQLLKKLIENEESAERWVERKAFENLLRKKFEVAFGFLPDRNKLAQNLFYRFINTEFSPRENIFDHKGFYQCDGNLIIVSQPYGIKETELTRWTKECGATFIIANEWGYYYPNHAKLFFVEFNPEAKSNLDKRIRAR
jgi:hypothetical protein